MDPTALLLSVVALPACGGAVALLARGAAPRPRLAASLAFSVSSVGCAAALASFAPGPEPVSLSASWISAIDARFALAADPLSLLMLLVAAALFPPALIRMAWERSEHASGALPGILFLQSAAAGAMLAGNLFTAMAFCCAAAAPLFFLVCAGHGQRSIFAAHKSALILAAASAPLLFASLLPVQRAGCLADLPCDIRGFDLLIALAFVPFTLAMGHGFPLHSWFTTAAAEGPRPVTALAGAVMPGIAACVFAKFAAPWIFAAASDRSPLFLAAAGLPPLLFGAGCLHFAVVSLAEENPFKRLAYLSCSVGGLAMLGLTSGQPDAFAAGIALLAFRSLFFGILFLIPAGKKRQPAGWAQ